MTIHLKGFQDSWNSVSISSTLESNFILSLLGKIHSEVRFIIIHCHGLGCVWARITTLSWRSNNRIGWIETQFLVKSSFQYLNRVCSLINAAGSLLREAPLANRDHSVDPSSFVTQRLSKFHLKISVLLFRISKLICECKDSKTVWVFSEKIFTFLIIALLPSNIF